MDESVGLVPMLTIAQPSNSGGCCLCYCRHPNYLTELPLIGSLATAVVIWGVYTSTSAEIMVQSLRMHRILQCHFYLTSLLQDMYMYMWRILILSSTRGVFYLIRTIESAYPYAMGVVKKCPYMGIQ